MSCEIIELENAPFLSGSFFCKYAVLSKARTVKNGRTANSTVSNFTIKWNENIPLGDILQLDGLCLLIRVKQVVEEGAETIGSVNVSIPQSLETKSKCIEVKALLNESRINASLLLKFCSSKAPSSTPTPPPPQLQQQKFSNDCSLLFSCSSSELSEEEAEIGRIFNK